MGVDFTATIRATPSVQAYVLVGEVDDGCCGDPWLTWGVQPPPGTRRDEPPPYERDGFERIEVPECSRLQLCRYDCKPFVGNSRTVLFRRL